MAKHDELAVTERQLKPPEVPKGITLNDILTRRLVCEKHGNPYSSVDLARVKATPTGDKVKLAGEIHIRFSGCTCRYWRPLK